MAESIFSSASATLVGLGLKSRKTDGKKRSAGLGVETKAGEIATPTLASVGALIRHES